MSTISQVCVIMIQKNILNQESFPGILTKSKYGMWGEDLLATNCMYLISYFNFSFLWEDFFGTNLKGRNADRDRGSSESQGRESPIHCSIPRWLLRPGLGETGTMTWDLHLAFCVSGRSPGRWPSNAASTGTLAGSVIVNRVLGIQIGAQIGYWCCSQQIN